MQLARFNSHPDRARGWFAALMPACLAISLLASPSAGQAGQVPNDGAVAAIPAMPELGGDGLPQVLSDRDAGLYREIFALLQNLEVLKSE